MNLADVLIRQGREMASRPAIIERSGTTSFAGLSEASARAAAMLQADGIRAGDPVLIFQPMSAELYIALTALFRLGAVAMFLDPSSGRRHMDACCQLMPPKALIAMDKAHLLRLTTASLRRIPLKYSIGWPVPGARRWTRRRQFEPLQQVQPVDSAAPALITFTSGSTGKPKAAVRTHGFLLSQHEVLARSIDLIPGEVDLSTLPIFTLANLASGVTSVIPDADLRRPGFIDTAPVLRQIQAHSVTRCAASPAFFERLLAADDGSLSRMRKLHTGGAPVFPRLLDALQKAAPEAKVEAVYGSTEAEPIAHAAAQQLTLDDRRAMSQGGGLLTGTAVPEIDLRIIAAQWGQPIAPLTLEGLAAITLPPGEVGEIVVSGPHVLPGYLHGHGDEETKFRVDGLVWHRTGDAGSLDKEGRLWLMGRCIARVQDSRGILWPFAVECAAMEERSVRRAALIAQEERRILVLETTPGTAQEQLRSALQQRLGWACLDQIHFVDRLPVDARHNAKIDYPALRRILESELRPPVSGR